MIMVPVIGQLDFATAIDVDNTSPTDRETWSMRRRHLSPSAVVSQQAELRNENSHPE